VIWTSGLPLLVHYTTRYIACVTWGVDGMQCSTDLLYVVDVEQLTEHKDVRMLQHLLDHHHTLTTTTALGQHTEPIQSLER
jgi:hypothetical protein